MKEKAKKITKGITLEKVVRLIIILVFLVIAFYLLWSFLITSQKNKSNVVDCLKGVYEDLKKEWREACRLENKEIGQDGLCPISPERAGKLYEQYNNRKNECLEKYPVE